MNRKIKSNSAILIRKQSEPQRSFCDYKTMSENLSEQFVTADQKDQHHVNDNFDDDKGTLNSVSSETLSNEKVKKSEQEVNQDFVMDSEHRVNGNNGLEPEHVSNGADHPDIEEVDKPELAIPAETSKAKNGTLNTRE